MSLKAFHVVFIASSVLLMLGMAGWCLQEYRQAGGTVSLAAGVTFLLAAAARGVSPRRLVWRHAWHVAIRPICGVYGLAIGALLSGSFIVEYVTAWPGMGRLMYEALRARGFDQAGIDILLVGDSLGMVVYGQENTLDVSMDDMIRHTRAVRRGTQRALVVATRVTGESLAPINAQYYDAPFGPPALLDLKEAFLGLAQEDDLRAVVLAGAGGRAFIGGADINHMARMRSSEDGRAFITMIHELCQAIRDCPVPVIARLEGYTLGAGLEIAAACDMRLAADRRSRRQRHDSHRGQRYRDDDRRGG